MDGSDGDMLWNDSEKKVRNGSSEYEKDEDTKCKDEHTTNSEDGKSDTHW
jgi:hypothetical protein